MTCANCARATRLNTLKYVRISHVHRIHTSRVRFLPLLPRAGTLAVGLGDADGATRAESGEFSVQYSRSGLMPGSSLCINTTPLYQHTDQTGG